MVECGFTCEACNRCVHYSCLEICDLGRVYIEDQLTKVPNLFYFCGMCKPANMLYDSLFMPLKKYELTNQNLSNKIIDQSGMRILEKHFTPHLWL